MPRKYTKRNMVESQEHVKTQGTAREFNKEGELPQIKIEPVDGINMTERVEIASVSNIVRNAAGKIISNPTRGKKWLDEMAFMNEIVTVRVHTTTDKTANPFPDIYVNGRVQRFARGAEQKVKRMFVAKLATSIGTIYGSVKGKDNEGEDKYYYPPSMAEVYPFTVIGDTPKGELWLKGLMSQQTA